nr:RecName: Full=Uncharacterized protein 1 [Olea europaea]
VLADVYNVEPETLR